MRPFTPLLVQLRQEIKNKVLDYFWPRQPWRMTSLHRLRYRDSCTGHRVDLKLVFECLVPGGHNVGRRDVSVGLMGDWR